MAQATDFYRVLVADDGHDSLLRCHERLSEMTRRALDPATAGGGERGDPREPGARRKR